MKFRKKKAYIKIPSQGAARATDAFQRYNHRDGTSAQSYYTRKLSTGIFIEKLDCNTN